MAKNVKKDKDKVISNKEDFDQKNMILPLVN
jgi:hypothetical protein